MAGTSNDERLRTVIRLAHAAADLPRSGRLLFVQSRSSDPQIIREALAMADRLDGPSDPPLRAGSLISRFILTEYLGSGGMGEVYAARDPELERIVAIKLLSPAWSGLAGAEEGFTREARIASALNHPNIVTVHEVVRHGSVVAIVMERVDGFSLRKLCGDPIPIPQLISIARQIAEALAAAHAAGIVHRDIKPENLMVRNDGRVKVLDFGLARRWPGAEATSYRSISANIPAGTWRYMSPEHYRNEAITSKADIFALGMVLFELSSGQHPFAADSPLETLHAIAVRDAAPPSGLNSSVPPTLDSAILSMLAKDPAKRPTAAVVLETLRQCEASVRASSAQYPPRLRTWALRMAAIVVLLSLATVFTAYRFFRKSPLVWEELTSLLPENHVTAAAVSPDGRFLSYANADGIFLRIVKSGETTLLDGPHDFAVDRMAWLPDGSRMIASGFSEETNRPAIWSISAASGRARELRADARFGDPSPDGSRIAFLSEDYSSIWTMASDGAEPHRAIVGSPEDSFPMVVWSPDGGFLIFERRHYSGHHDNGFVMFDRFYDRSLESAKADSGRVIGRLPNLWVQTAARLPEGRMLLLRLESAGSPYANQLWETRIDKTTGNFAGSLRRIAAPVDDGRGRIVGMSATADGSTIEALREHGQASVFVGEFDPVAFRFAHTRRLTLDERSSYPHAWTADSGSVIYESNRNGSWDIFRQRVGDRVPDLIAGSPKRSEVLPQLSPDGKFVLYAEGPDNGPRSLYTLMRVPLEGGPAVEVPIDGALDEFRCSLQASGRCVVRKTIGREYFAYFELDPVKGIGRQLARTFWQESVLSDWDVSPDGAFVALPNHDSRSARVRVIPLLASRSSEGERTVEFAGLTNISGVTWAAEGRAWFVTITTSIGRRVFYCDSEGRAHSLGDTNGWVVPARAGRRIAYENTLFETNAWDFRSR